MRSSKCLFGRCTRRISSRGSIPVSPRGGQDPPDPLFPLHGGPCAARPAGRDRGGPKAPSRSGNGHGGTSRRAPQTCRNCQRADWRRADSCGVELMSVHLRPEEIEAESFRTIDPEAGPHEWPAAEWPVVRRVIHTSADFEYVRTMFMSADAVAAGVKALQGRTGHCYRYHHGACRHQQTTPGTIFRTALMLCCRSDCSRRSGSTGDNPLHHGHAQGDG